MNRDEFRALLLGDRPPISFTHDGHDDAADFSAWKKEDRVNSFPGYTEYRRTCTDPKGSLSCELAAKVYEQFPAIDWVVHFKNIGKGPTAILEDIKALAWVWEPRATAGCTVDYAKGSDCKIDDFLPQSEDLKNWVPREFKGVNGRPSVTTLPFCRVRCGDEHLVIALGWTGQWLLKLDMTHAAPDAATLLSIEAGMERTRLRLFPGEAIRTPRVLLYFGKGDAADVQNDYRRLLLAHYAPSINGQRPHVPLAYPSWGGSTIAKHIERLDIITRNRYPYEYYWVDAGWFIDESETKYDEFSGTWAAWVGRWRPNKKLYPKGLKQLGDAVHVAGLKFLLWVEPERARINTDLPKQHPDWFLKRPGAHADVLLDLGNPAARSWLIEFVSGLVRECGLDCYRQDFNFDPQPYWDAADAPDRRGMSEIKHVMGLYEVWDTLRQRFPALLIDNCASGGRRIDLETTSRSFPLWRSDFQCFPGYDATGSQVHTAGLAEWIPLSSTGTQPCPGDTYHVRSSYSSGLVFHDIASSVVVTDPARPRANEAKDYPIEWHKQLMAEYLEARPYLEGDFYRLTAVSISPYDWLALQFHRADLNGGIVLAFRRASSPYVQAQFPLHAVDPGERYKIERSGVDGDESRAGSELGEQGLIVTLDRPRTSALVFYKMQD